MPSKSYVHRKTPTQTRALHTWHTILDGAAQVLLRVGYAKATTNRIAERAGVSVGTIYQYFPNKDALFAALQLRWNERRWDALVTGMQAISEDDVPESVVRKVVRARIRATALDPRLNTLLLKELPDHVTQTQASELHDQFVDRSIAEVSRFNDRIRRPNAALMVELVIHATHAVVDNLGAEDEELLNSQAFEDELTDMICRYMLAEPTDSA